MSNKISFITFLKIFIFGFAITSFFITAGKADAATVCDNATVHVVARDQSGVVIPGISYQILATTTNSDGQVRPGSVVSSGKIDTILGEGKSIFSPTSGNYIVKMYDKSSTYGAFYFYDELTVACGEEKTFTAYLSGLRIELRDSNGTLRKNTPFTLSLQAYDANGQPIKQKGATVAALNSDVTGQNMIYLADSSHTIDQQPVSYVFSSAGYGGSEFALYDISLTDKKTKEINYFFSDILIKFRDKNSNILPAGTKVEFLTQKSDITGRVVADKLIKELSVDSYGYVLFEYPAGAYFVRIKKTGGGYYNFPDINIVDRIRTSRTLEAVDDSAEQIACTTNATLNVVARKASGGYIPGIKIELYEKALNANNLPAAGALTVRGTTNDLGNGSVSFKPNSGKAYILKMYDKNAAVGAFWYYDDIKFNCGENKNISKNLSSISLTARDTGGNLLKDYAFSLYLQKKDIDNNILKTKDYLVADAKTNAEGRATIYVTGGDPAQYQDIARYLISIKYGGGLFDKPDISLAAGADTQVDYALSGLNLTMIDTKNNVLVKGANVDIYEQKIDIDKNKILFKNVARLALDDYGKGIAALPAGTYALSFQDKNKNIIKIWDIKINNGQLNNKTITFPLTANSADSDINANTAPASTTSSMANRLKGYVLLQTESRGEAWYVSPNNQKRYYLKDGSTAFGIMKKFGLGISNSNLNKIPIGFMPSSQEADCDNDGLSDSLENAIGTEICNNDTDGDGYTDSSEIIHNYSPLATSKSNFDEKITSRLSGAILLQVESNGEAWYVNPKDKKRYYFKDGAAAFKIMKYLSLGIKNSDLNMVGEAE